MPDSPNPAADDPDDLLALGLQVAFQARLADSMPPTRGPAISRIEGDGHAIDSLLLPQPAGAGGPAGKLASPEDVPTGVGKYRILEELGRGGLGVVLKARDTDLGRDTAMKVLLRRRKQSTQALQRFVEEAQVAGQLQHPGIVPVYEMGVLPDASPYFTMKLVNGRTLSALLKERTASAEERLRLLVIFEQVCQAVAYAHSRGVVHRDLKPANVMVGAFGEVQVMDWGLSKVLGRDGAADLEAPPAGAGLVETARSRDGSSQSLHGTVMGTPAYMPPEQARGEVARMDKRSDVFSLGAILCEILTGAPPYVGDSGAQVLQLAASADLEPARRRLAAGGEDEGLVRIARACLAAAPADRLEDAGSLAVELRAYLTSLEERARAAELARVRALARAASERKARRLTVTLAGFILLALSLGGGAYVVVERERRARQESTARAIEDAVTESRLLLGQARTAPVGETSKWSEALQAVRHASTLASTGNAGEQDRIRVASLIAEVQRGEDAARRAAERARADHAMRERIEEIRLSRADPGVADWKQQDEAYTAAFRAYGIDFEAAGPENAAASIRESSIRPELTSALDEWVEVRRSRGDIPEAGWRPLAKAAADSDPDPWRVRVREVALSGRLDELRSLAREANVSALSATSAWQLAEWLHSARDEESALAVCRAALKRHPEDFWLNTSLGIWLLLTKPPDVKSSARYLTAAVALRPTASRAWNNLGCALTRLRDVDGSIAAYEQALRLDSGSYHALNNLGSMLIDKGDIEAALRVLRQAVEAGPDFPEARTNLGIALEKQGSLDEAVECFRRASKSGAQGLLALARLSLLLEEKGDFDGAIEAYRQYIAERPGNARAHLALGTVLARSQKLDLAIPELREAIRLDPNLADAHGNLGSALLASGDPHAAAAALKEAVRLDPGFARGYSNLSAAYERMGDAHGALAACREAVRIDPNHAQAHFNLGVCLERVGDSDGARVAFQEAARRKPDWGDAHLAHGRLLEQKGLYAEALEVYRRAEEWSRQSASIRSKYESRLRACERRADLASRLGEFLYGNASPASGEEGAELAEICYARGLHVDAARLWAAAFEASPELVRSLEDGWRHAAACSAVLAGFPDSQGPGVARDPAAKARSRQRGLEWLRQDLADIEAASRRPGADREALAGMLADRTQDPDFACVRDKEALGLLGEAERAAWLSLWAESARLQDALAPAAGLAPAK